MGRRMRRVLGGVSGSVAETVLGAAQSPIGRSIQERVGRKAAALRKQITEDRTISDETRKELLGQLGDDVTSGSLRAAGSTFAKAKKGTDPLFKSRQVLQERRNILRDRPGRRQTLMGNFGSGGDSGITIAGGKG